MRRRSALLVLVAVIAAGCTPREVEKDLQITDVRTGWHDAGIVEDGKNKLVPSATFKLKNVSPEDIASVQLNAVFRRAGEPAAWGEHYINAIDRNGLTAGATGNPLVLRSPLGYTGTQPRLQMLENKAFVDARVEVYGKHGSRAWVKMAEYPIERQLLTE